MGGLRPAAFDFGPSLSPVGRTPSQGALRVRPSRKGQIEGKRVLLIGGVRTKGATLKACTRALKQAGARHVDVLVPERVVRDSGVTI